MTRRATTIGACLLALGASGLIGAAAAGAPSNSYEVHGALNARAETPAPTGVPAAARGSFIGILDGNKLYWRLSFRGLSGPAIAAHIHLGARGVAGAVAVPLCGPCQSGIVGTATLTRAQVTALRAGRTYVNVHTPRNGAGEIRAQLRAVR
jgi:hypothetical protein